jgi:hypothetical protein
VNTFICYVCAPLDKLDARDLVEDLADAAGIEVPDWLRSSSFLDDYCFADWSPKCSWADIWHLEFAETVCGDSECAKAYFTGVGWLTNSEWQDGLSGKENMAYSSEKLLRGEDKMKKSTAPSWR